MTYSNFLKSKLTRLLNDLGVMVVFRSLPSFISINGGYEYLAATEIKSRSCCFHQIYEEFWENVPQCILKIIFLKGNAEEKANQAN